MINFPTLTPSHNMSYLYSHKNHLIGRKWIGICMHRIHSRLIHGVLSRECQHHHKKLLLFLGAFHNSYIYEVHRDNLIIKTLLIISFLIILTLYPWFWYDQVADLLWKKKFTTNTSFMYVTCLTILCHIRHPFSHIRNMSDKRATLIG